MELVTEPLHRKQSEQGQTYALTEHEPLFVLPSFVAIYSGKRVRGHFVVEGSTALSPWRCPAGGFYALIGILPGHAD